MISILMPVHNGIEFIDESVSSVLYQSYDKWELIIGINGHEQNSDVYKYAKILENIDQRIQVIDLYKIKGKSNALNEMKKYCKYDWICLLDVDDKWLPTKLHSQIIYMSDYDVIGTRCKYFGDSNVIPCIPSGNITNFNFFLYNPLINSSCLLKKELAYWDKFHDGVEDYDLWLSLRKKNKKFYNVNTIQVLHRLHNNSAFNAQGNYLKIKELLKKYY